MNFDRFSGLFGIIIILILGCAFSTNRKLINYRLVFVGLLLQFITGIFILKMPLGKDITELIAKVISSILDLSKEGASFVFGFLVDENMLSEKFHIHNSYIFATQVIPTIIFICSLVSIFYYFGILQRIVQLFAWIFNQLLNVSGAEALANSACVFVGQVESAIVIQPYLSKLTKSELLTIMTGGMACISGALMLVYSTLGIKIEYLLAASFMAAPGSFVISKIFYPEDKIPITRDTVKIEYKTKESSLIEAVLDGAYNGAKICIGIIAMLIAFICLVALVDKLLNTLNHHLSLKLILGYIFTPVIYFIGVPKNEVITVAQLFGTKLALNEFIAYLDLAKLISTNALSLKSTAIASFLLCGFANFGSIGIQVGGLSQMSPERKSELAKLGLKAMICGALVSCISGCMVGILI